MSDFSNPIIIGPKNLVLVWNICWYTVIIALELELLNSEVQNAPQVQKYPSYSECSLLPFTIIIIKSCSFKVVKIFICKQIGIKNSVSWLLIVHQLCEKGSKCNFESIIPTEIKKHHIFYVLTFYKYFCTAIVKKEKEI